MSQEELRALIESAVGENLSADDLLRLQHLLKNNAGARALFRERMDLEAGLHTWAAEGPGEFVEGDVGPTARSGRAPLGRRTRFRAALAGLAVVAAMIVLLVAPRFASREPATGGAIGESPEDAPRTPPAPRFVGRLRQQSNCKWEGPPASTTGRFALEKLSLAAGVAELNFDSGTEVVLEAPCELLVTSADSARLLTGKVFVNVTELSSGFTLETPEARILDEGTQYAVALDETSTEVHVFDGSVIWLPEVEAAKGEDRIEAGEAKRFPRRELAQAQRITFGQRKFVRQLEADVKAQAGDALLAYDGFENLAGQIQRDRSGFGWSGGWQAAGIGRGRTGRGRLATVVDAPDDVVFGLRRSGRRLLSLTHGDNMRRDFEQPLIMQPGDAYFISCLMRRATEVGGQGQSLQISLEPNALRQGRRRRQILAFGVATDGFPFIKSEESITETAARIGAGDTYLCVLKVVVTEQGVLPYLRIYRAEETVDEVEPSVWTVTGSSGSSTWRADSIRLAVGQHADWWIDELKLGTTWRSVACLGNSE